MRIAEQPGQHRRDQDEEKSRMQRGAGSTGFVQLSLVTVPLLLAPDVRVSRQPARRHHARNRRRDRQRQGQIPRRAVAKGGQARNDQAASTRRAPDLVTAVACIAGDVLAAMRAGEFDFVHGAGAGPAGD